MVRCHEFNLFSSFYKKCLGVFTISLELVHSVPFKSKEFFQIKHFPLEFCLRKNFKFGIKVLNLNALYMNLFKSYLTSTWFRNDLKMGDMDDEIIFMFYCY